MNSNHQSRAQVIAMSVIVGLIPDLGKQTSVHAGDTGMQRTAFKSALRIQGRDHDVEVVRSLRQLHMERQDGPEIAQFHLLEVLSRPTTDALGRSRRVWWALTLSPGDDVVQGDPVFAVTATTRGGSPLLVLVMANTYYATTSLLLIDPLREISEVPSQIQSSGASRDIQPLAQRLTADSQVERLEVPLDLRGRLYGTKAIDASSDDVGVVLRIQLADASIVRLRYDLSTKNWARLPVE